jgi:HEAT repeat protein
MKAWGSGAETTAVPHRFGFADVSEAARALSDHAETLARRTIAARALGEFGGEVAEEALIEATSDPATADAARLGLRLLFRREASQARQFLADRYQQWAAELRIGSLKELITLISDPQESADRRARACAIAGGLRFRAAVDPLVGLIEQGDPQLARAASHALAEIQSRRATRRLIRVVLSQHPAHVRESAILALRFLADPRCGQALRRVLDAANEPISLRVRAAEALGDLRPKRFATQALLRAAEAEHPELRYAAISALRPESGDPKVLSTLRMLTHDGAETHRGETVSSLARLRLAHSA